MMPKIFYFVLLNLLILPMSYAMNAFIHLQNNTQSDSHIISKVHFVVYGNTHKLVTNQSQIIAVPVGEKVEFKISKITRNGQNVDPVFFQTCYNGYYFKLNAKQTAVVSIFLNKGFIDNEKYYICDISIK
jgi:hypothetical protein